MSSLKIEMKKTRLGGHITLTAKLMEGIAAAVDPIIDEFTKIHDETTDADTRRLSMDYARAVSKWKAETLRQFV